MLVSRHQLVDTKSLSVEEDPLRQTERSIEILVEGAVETFEIDGQLFE